MDLSNVTAITSLPVSDVERASAWYRDHLGVVPTETNPIGARFECGGGTSFFLYQSEFAGTNKGTSLMFQADDFDGTIADLRGRGVVFEDYDFGDLKTVDGVFTDADGSRSAWFKDSDSNIIAIGTGV
jgi:catechol 2,3-dioxygenase-like lactoylglutathione lyase family enzyme